jgi:outer membrane protein
MRKFSLFVLFAASITMLYNCQKPQPTVAFNPSQTAGGKVVFVNIDTLLEKYDLYKDNKKQLEEEGKKAESNLAAKMESFQKRASEFQRKVYEVQQKAQDIAPVELKRLEAEYGAQQKKLAEEEQALGKQRENAAVELDKKVVELQKTLKAKIDAYLEKISAERGYDYVLMKGSSYSVLYGNKSLDITNETITAINAAYAAEKK